MDDTNSSVFICVPRFLKGSTMCGVISLFYVNIPFVFLFVAQ